MNATKTRTGRVLLKTNAAPEQWQSFLVHEEDGKVCYYLGAPARTSDGWASLAAEYHDRITWDAEPAICPMCLRSNDNVVTGMAHRCTHCGETFYASAE